MYEYECPKGHRFEKIEKFSASPNKKCPTCGAKAQRQISTSSVKFKGSGWYATDYGGKSAAGESARKDKDTAVATDSKGDAKGASKSDAKVEAKPPKSGDSKTTASSSASSSSSTSSSTSSAKE
jgi:putative FmdB family regulatory protein